VEHLICIILFFFYNLLHISAKHIIIKNIRYSKKWSLTKQILKSDSYAIYIHIYNNVNIYFKNIFRDLYIYHIYFNYFKYCKIRGPRGGVVVKALRYKPAGREFDSQ
jgi:hypothetical protein